MSDVSFSISIIGNSNNTNAVSGDGKVVSGAACAASCGPCDPFYKGTDFVSCPITTDGVGPCYAICHFKMNPSMLASRLANNGAGDASWVAFDTLISESGVAFQDSTVKIGSDILTNVHYSYDATNLDSGVIHVTHIYPSILDLYLAWGNVLTAPPPGSPGGGIDFLAGVAMHNKENYIEFVGVPDSAIPILGSFLNENNAYSHMLADASFGGNLFRFGKQFSKPKGNYRPECFRQGTLNTVAPVELDGSGVDVVTPEYMWDGTENAGNAITGNQVIPSLDALKAVLPNVNACVKAAVPPTANIAKL